MTIAELCESLGVGHKRSSQIEGAFLKLHGTSYRKEVKQYKRLMNG